VGDGLGDRDGAGEADGDGDGDGEDDGDGEVVAVCVGVAVMVGVTVTVGVAVDVATDVAPEQDTTASASSEVKADLTLVSLGCARYNGHRPKGPRGCVVSTGQANDPLRAEERRSPS